MRKLLLVLAFLLCSGPAFAQCTGVFQPNSLCGNVGPAAAPPHQITGITSVFGPAATTSGDLANWLGITGVTLGDSGVPTSIFTGPQSLFLATPATSTGKVTLRGIVNSDLPTPTTTAGGAVRAYTSPASQFIITITTSGAVLSAQPSCGSLTNASPTCSTDGTNASNIISGTLSSARLAWNWSVLQFGPNTFTTTVSTVGVMSGYGGNCKITPSFSTRVYVNWYGDIANSTNGDGSQVTAFYGTGTAPVSGVLVTGTNTSAFTALPVQAGLTGLLFPFSFTTMISGLTPGTAYWLDLKLQALAGGSALISNVFCTGHEE